MEVGGTGTPEEQLGEGRGSHNWNGPPRSNRDGERPPRRVEDGKGTASISPAHLEPGEPAVVPGLILCPPRPHLATWVLRVWEEGRGEGERKGRGQTGPVPLRGVWGKGGVPTLEGGPPTVRESMGSLLRSQA